MKKIKFVENITYETTNKKTHMKEIIEKAGYSIDKLISDYKLDRAYTEFFCEGESTEAVNTLITIAQLCETSLDNLLKEQIEQIEETLK